MQAVSARFLTTIAASHAVVVVCEVWSGIGGTLLTTLQPMTGSVTVDVANAVRRRCVVSFADPTGTLSPTGPSSILAPYGNELRLYRGVAYGDGTTELVPLGVFGITDVTVDDKSGSTVVVVDASDRSRKVTRAKLSDVYAIAAGTDTASALKALIQNRVPLLATGLFAFLATTTTTPLMTLQPGDDPWQVAQNIATSAGLDLFFDAAGICTLRKVLDPKTAAIVGTYLEGAGATLLGLSRKVTDRETYNDVVVTGESTGLNGPIRVQVVDNDTSSPTYISGGYGDVIRFYSSPLLTSTAQATAAGTAILNRGTGLVEQVTFDAIVNPALDVDDVVQIIRAASQTNARYSLDALTIPLEWSVSMAATTRKRSA